MGHPSYTESIDDADVVLLDFDSLRQCLYPTYKVDCHQKLKPELPASMTWEVEDQGPGTRNLGAVISAVLILYSAISSVSRLRCNLGGESRL